MTTVTLIQCTATKRDSPAPAAQLYDKSAYFRAMRDWAHARKRTLGDKWYILSAKHGLLGPDEIIAPYDERGLDAEQCEEIAATLSDHGVDTVHVSAGRDYTDELIPALEAVGMDVVNHFAGCRIGTRQQKLTERAEELLDE